MNRTARAWIVTGVIAALGALGGAAVAVVLTFVGNIVSGAPLTPGVAIYRWNAGIFAVFGAVGSPLLAWSMLRNVPIWRAVIEPAAAGLVSTFLCFLAAPALFPLVVPSAILAAAWRLNASHNPVAPAITSAEREELGT